MTMLGRHTDRFPGHMMASLVLLLAATALPAQAVVVQADVEGAIGPATARFVETVLEQAADRNAALVVLRMDTPGGLDQSMRVINKAILGSTVPVATFVAPSGARAASAGTFILYASHIAAMAPGTNLGAATPVNIGGGMPTPEGTQPGTPKGEDGASPPDDETGKTPPATGTSGGALSRKAVNDAAAYIRGLAELRGRNAEWAERAVRDAASLSSTEALEQGVIDLLVADLPALLREVDGREVVVLGKTVTLQVAGLATQTIEPGWLTKLLAIITNPNIAFVLVIVGFYGLVFEFSNPGSIGPGVVGIICLLLGMYALNLLPLDYTGLALVLVGIGFMVAEAFTPTFGVLGLGGVIAFVIGASMLVDADSPHFRLSWQVIAGTTIASAVLLTLVLGFSLRAQRRPVTTGAAELTDEPATVLEWADGRGFVRARGERWRARGEKQLSPGTQVKVVSVHGLELEVTSRDTQSQRTTGDSL